MCPELEHLNFSRSSQSVSLSLSLTLEIKGRYGSKSSARPSSSHESPGKRPSPRGPNPQPLRARVLSNCRKDDVLRAEGPINKALSPSVVSSHPFLEPPLTKPPKASRKIRMSHFACVSHPLDPFLRKKKQNPSLVNCRRTLQLDSQPARATGVQPKK